MKPQPQSAISDAVYIPLVHSLFQAGQSLFIGSLIVIAALMACYAKTGEWAFFVVALTFALLSATRMLGIRKYNSLVGGLTNREMAARWEIYYVTGATAAVSLLGLWCFLAFAITKDPFVQLISFSLTIGYIIGIFGRNFGSSKFVNIQAFCVWLPMTAALLMFGDTYHWAFAALLLPLFLGIGLIAERLRSMLLEAIEARKKAEASLVLARDEARKSMKARKRVVELLSRLRQSQRSEEAAIATRDQHMRFLATMSHEIRTPLNGIVGALELVRTAKAEKVPILLETASNSADALLELVSEVLDLARLEYGEGAPASNPFDCRELLRFVQLAMEPIARTKKLDLKIHIDADVPKILLGDQRKIRQVLINLVGNALKFTETGSVSLCLHLATRDASSMVAEFVVQDTGIGISASAVANIYDPFYTAAPLTNRGSNSSGLGLAIVQKSTKSMGGTIECQSTLGVGTTFKVRVPLGIGEDASPMPLPPILIEQSVPAAPARILLVEDNETNAMLVRDMLEPTPHSVDRAAGGFEAIRMATEQDYDIILMDISMPDLDGVSACQQIRKIRGNVWTAKIIALTANAVVGDRERYLTNGFDGYLSKPIRRDTLLAAIEGAASLHPDFALPAPPVAQANQPALDRIEFASFLADRSPDRAARLLAIFCTELSSIRTGLQVAHADHQVTKVKQFLHTIVGMTASIGAIRLTNLARQQESECLLGRMPSQADIDLIIMELSLAIAEATAAKEQVSGEVA